MISPPLTIKNEELWRKQCRKVRALAQRIIEGKVGVIEGSRQMLTFQIWLHAHADGSFRIFRVVDSISKDLPVGKVGALWAPAVLEEKKVKIQEVEDLYRSSVIDAAGAIKEKYQTE